VTLELTPGERDALSGDRGAATAMAMRILTDAASIMGASRLVEITSAHIDGCLYHGDGGVEFAEALVAGGGRVAVPTTLNVGALDLLHPGRVRGDGHHTVMARRQMEAYRTLGCAPTWTCAPYQAGHRPGLGEQVAWGESNAVAFANSVLGARTERYGDFLDACCALTGRAPLAGLHTDEARRATVVIDVTGVPGSLKDRDVFYPVLGTWLGLEVGREVCVIVGVPPGVTEDRLKSLGAAAASTGAVALFHVAGVTPEAPTKEAALGGATSARTVTVTADRLLGALARLSTASEDTSQIDAVAVGSPHFSRDEFSRLLRLLGGRRVCVPFYACTGRHVVVELEASGELASLEEAGVQIVADTCVVVAPILPDTEGVLMTCSGKFAHYGPANTGHQVIFGSLEDCVESAVAGRVRRDAGVWSW
jgi:predicted aconitase